MIGIYCRVVPAIAVDQ